jgi:glycosyltransferase involved in cell wall biosynthesis
MKISVIIPSYNAGKTIEATLASVFTQTVQPDEILVLNDGSTDDTLARLEKYKDRITVLSQKNGGSARSRNHLVQAARGDMLAFLDSDDIWHPHYLERQRAILLKYPDITASFTDHFDIPNDGVPDWNAISVNAGLEPKIFDPVSFLQTYNTTTGVFGSPSFCCVKRAAIERLPGQLLHPDLNVTDDVYLFHRLALLGPIARLATKLVAYRLTSGSLSTNRLSSNALCVCAFELLASEYERAASPELKRAFRIGFSAKRRVYARSLLGVGKVGEARRQLRLAMQECANPKCVVKSLALLLLTLAPKRLQLRWPAPERVVNVARNQIGMNNQMTSGK